MTTPGQLPLVIGHRGFAARFPDNTRAGVAAALAAGADGVEVDVRPCSEGVWICHHDRTRAGRPVAEWQVGALRAAGVPTLAEVTAAVSADRWLFVEVKPLASETLLELVDPLAHLLAGRLERTLLLSSSLGVLGGLAVAMPRAVRSWVIDRIPDAVPPGLALSPKHTLVERLIGSGLPLHPWTVNRERRIGELARIGVASITSNRPDLAREVLGG